MSDDLSDMVDDIIRELVDAPQVAYDRGMPTYNVHKSWCKDCNKTYLNVEHKIGTLSMFAIFCPECWEIRQSGLKAPLPVAKLLKSKRQHDKDQT